MTQIRRVVTGHDESGKAVVLSDGPVPTVHSNPIRPGEVWGENGGGRCERI